jgi:hypothetical protein
MMISLHGDGQQVRLNAKREEGGSEKDREGEKVAI